MDDGALQFLRSEEIGVAPFLREPDADMPLPYAEPTPAQNAAVEMMVRGYEVYSCAYVDYREMVVRRVIHDNIYRIPPGTGVTIR